MSHQSRLLRLLEESGPLSSAAVQRALGISRPTLSRVMRETDGEILRLGRTRRVRYAVPRPLPGLPESIPVARVDEDGRARPHARIHPLMPEEWAWESEEGELRIGTGLPREVADLLPAGYLGRTLAGDGSETALLQALDQHGEDLPGNLIVGEQALARFLALDPPARRLDELPELARAAESGRQVGGLVDGDWPKFTAWMENHQIIAKFAHLDGGEAEQRRADLLVAEQLALESLRGLDIPVPASRIIDQDGYRFLALARFDRVGRLGRRGVIRLGRLTGKGVDPTDWTASARALARSKRLPEGDAERIARLACFAGLIGNTNSGGDKLAFFTDEDEQLRLAPAYDMLPSALTPDADGALPEALPPLPMPAAGELTQWRQAARAAADYCQRLGNEQRLSFDLRKIAAARGKAIAERLQRVG